MMIVQSVLFFVLGVVTTAFFVTLLAPAFWRRAMSLAYKTVRTQVPLSLTEVEADRDFLRAQHAVAICRLEEKLQAERDAHVERRARLDTAQERIHALAALEPLCADLQGRIVENERLIADLEQTLRQSEDQVSELSALKPLYDKQKKQLEELQRKASRLESSNEKLNEQLKTAVKVDRQTLKAFRDDIKAIAARVAADAAIEEGAASPIIKLTAQAKSDDSLAGTIRQLYQQSKGKKAAGVHKGDKADKPGSAVAKTGA